MFLRPGLLLAALCAVAAGASAQSTSVHLTYHWHLHQPIYWPENFSGTNRYQFAGDSITLKLSNTGNFYPGSSFKHPRNALVQGDGGEFDNVFDRDDRIRAYQAGGRDSLATLGGFADAGASVSYSGALQENIWSLGKDSRFGYGPGWNDGYRTARGWLTSAGKPKADMLGMTYHHAFSPLLPRSVFRKELQIFKEIWWKSWGGNPDKSDHSKGFWPIEAAFSETMIPVLVEEGYEWTIVANSHLARTVANYLDVAARGSGGYNIDPPNKADITAPAVPANQWFSGTRDARGGTFPAPFAYQAHKARYVHPATGQAVKITIVPMCDYLSYENGYASMGTGVIDAKIAPFNNPARPSLVLLAHDGDNAWGGGSSYYFESVPGLMNEAASKGYRPTTIATFLAQHPVPDDAVVHVEDGAWVNAADDWGHPLFPNWLYPPTRAPSDPAYHANDPRTYFDFENPGWTEDWRNWAVLMAGANWCETAEQITLDAGGAVQAWKIQEPVQRNGTNNQPNPAEQAWHYYLGGLDSGFMYYGTSLDDEVKQTLASNRAIAFAQQVVGSGSEDRTPPTVFKPQRFPWNPGGKGWGPLTRYRAVGMDGNPPWPNTFHIWTHVYDLSGVASVRLHLRAATGGANASVNDDHRTYAGGPSVGPWTTIDMTRRTVPTGNVTNHSQVSFFLTPTAIADYYFARVTGYRNQLVDYYIESTDSRGNVARSDIQHVFVADDGNGGVTPTPTPTPIPGGPTPTPTPTPTPSPTPTPAPPGAAPFVLDGAADSPGYSYHSGSMSLYAAIRGTKLYLATWSPGNAGGANDHFLLVTDSLLSGATAPAPWAKAGFTAVPAGKPFLGGESLSTYAGWFNTSGPAQVGKAPTNAGQLEGVIDLVANFGAVPPTIYVAALAYSTADGGALVAQTPAGNGNGDVEPAEFLAIPTAAIVDANADGFFDRLQPGFGFFPEIGREQSGALTITWPTVPGRAYVVQFSEDLVTPWQHLATLTAGVTQLSATFADTAVAGSGAGRRFYRVVLP